MTVDDNEYQICMILAFTIFLLGLSAIPYLYIESNGPIIINNEESEYLKNYKQSIENQIHIDPLKINSDSSVNISNVVQDLDEFQWFERDVFNHNVYPYEKIGEELKLDFEIEYTFNLSLEFPENLQQFNESYFGEFWALQWIHDNNFTIAWNYFYQIAIGDYEITSIPSSTVYFEFPIYFENIPIKEQYFIVSGSLCSKSWDHSHEQSRLNIEFCLELDCNFVFDYNEE